MMVFEAVGIGALGGVVGTSCGVIATSLASASRGWTPVLEPALLALAPTAGIVVGVVSGVYPALYAARISPMRALRG
jgi:ABC-type antimicrobial peptide transport system permease subunit